MSEKIIPVTIDMFQPEVEDRMPETNRQLALLMRDRWGRDSLRFRKIMRAGGNLPEDAPKAIDDYVFGSSRIRYSLPEYVDLREFYLQNQKHAIGIIEFYHALLPALDGLELKDEISLLSDRPSNLFELASMPEGQIDPVLAYEAHRHILVTDISAMIASRTLNNRLRTRLSDVHRLLNQVYFSGPVGAGSRVVLGSIHDDETNQVIGFPNTMQRIPATAHLKTVPTTVRKIRREVIDVGKDELMVYTSPRKKDDRLAVIKCLVKAKKNGGVVDINHMDTGVLDPIGMIIVLMDDRAKPEELADKTASIINSDPKLRVVGVEKDDKTGKDHGQAAEMNFSARRRTWFEDIQVPLELIFYDRETYLNSRLEVGTRDPQTGLHNGRAHELYGNRRAEEGFTILFPKKRFPVNSPDCSGRAFINRSLLYAEELRAMYKVS
ncbi:hypothetical protein HY384_03925 [Candidatus Daviesbacteria bacterium]|nr:hypothetical protein [Candidatus Daviesbacteria bacterium]